MLTHENATSFVDWCSSVFLPTEHDRFSSHAPFHFDLSILDIYVALKHGATLFLISEDAGKNPKDLAQFIARHKLTMWYSTPSILTLLVQFGKLDAYDHSSLRIVNFAGEVFPVKHLRDVKRHWPAPIYFNLYGPTETNVCTYYRVDALPEDDATIPIGRACENTEVFAIRQDGEVAGTGEEGELFVRGSAVMTGYWGRPERSAEVLVPDPRSPGSPELVYRTGDLVRLRDDGDYDFVGRRDHQIKSRGYRVELGEVEAALNADPRLDTAVAVGVPHEDWGAAIVAYVVPKDGPMTEVDVKRAAATRLPRFMVPVRVEVRDQLPRTSTGKVDRRSVEDDAMSRAWSWE
jgi:acyl-coenzyme A synthetase/AMP-(fatty) acid ligase